MSRIVAGRLARGGFVAPGWVEIAGGAIAACGDGAPPREPDERLDGILSAGLFDSQVNGGAGHEVTDGPVALDAIDRLQLAHGVTSYLPTLISPDDATAERVLPELAERAADPSSPVAGVHVEGPFLSPEHAGMHPRERLREPAAGVPGWLGHSVVRVVTLAPELPGALELVQRLRDRGVAVSLGHSGASVDVVRAAADAGATLVTHVFNAMGPLHHRAPGLAGEALADERLQVCAIADGLHVHPVALEVVRRAAGARAILVSDSGPAAGAPAGGYRMAGVAVTREPDGSVRTADGRLAGSALTLDAAVRNWAGMTGASLGEALMAAGETPASAIGLDVGTIRQGAAADLVLLDATGNVLRTMRRGHWAGAAPDAAPDG